MSKKGEQWFLDLDGVRSGPYQTPEVLSLVAEGEILPHHKISTALKDQKWITVLDWRLDQARSSNLDSNNSLHKRPITPEIQEMNSEQAEMPSPEDIHVIEPLKEDTKEGIPIIEMANLKNTSNNPTEPEHPVGVEPLKIEPVSAPVAPVFISEKPAATESSAPPKTKRDPMAEMFDILQNSKQKREAKNDKPAGSPSSSSSSTSSLPPIFSEIKPYTPSPRSWGRTLGIGVGMIIGGFLLGQMFQQSSNQPLPEKTVTTSAPDSAAPVNPERSPVIETVDRSNEKMIIRGKVERRMDAAQAPAKQNEKEIEDLKSLKKELQELKALKDELKNNNGPNDQAPNHADDDMDDGFDNSGIDPTYNYPAGGYQPGDAVYGYPKNGVNPNAVNPNAPNGGRPYGNESPSDQNNIHY